MSTVQDVLNGTLSLNQDGTFTYIPDEGFNGTDTFTYQVDDGNGGVATATATIVIDNDGDGYDNATDLDDDNDGILDQDECPVAGVDGGIYTSIAATGATIEFNVTSSNDGGENGEHILDSIKDYGVGK